MTQPLAPTGIQADRTQGLLVIEWNDGQRSTIPFMLLRDACPCATCRNEAKSANEADNDFIIPLFDEREYNLESLEVVGNYAINPVWADGHRYGIYQWAYLRSVDQAVS
jgi:DUF971 family protein